MGHVEVEDEKSAPNMYNLWAKRRSCGSLLSNESFRCYFYEHKKLLLFAVGGLEAVYFQELYFASSPKRFPSYFFGKDLEIEFKQP